MLPLLLFSLADNAGSSSIVDAFLRTNNLNNSNNAPAGSSLSTSAPPGDIEGGVAKRPPLTRSLSREQLDAAGQQPLSRRSQTAVQARRRVPPSTSATLEHRLVRSLPPPVQSMSFTLGVSSDSPHQLPRRGPSNLHHDSTAAANSTSSSKPTSQKAAATSKWVRFTDIGRPGRALLHRLSAHYHHHSHHVDDSDVSHPPPSGWDPDGDTEAQALLQAIRECKGIVVVVDCAQSVIENNNNNNNKSQSPAPGLRAVAASGSTADSGSVLNLFDLNTQSALSQQKSLVSLLTLLQSMPLEAKKSKKKQKRKEATPTRELHSLDATKRPVPPLFLVANKQDVAGATCVQDLVRLLSLQETDQTHSSSPTHHHHNAAVSSLIGRWTCQPASLLYRPQNIVLRLMKFFLIPRNVPQPALPQQQERGKRDCVPAPPSDSQQLFGFVSSSSDWNGRVSSQPQLHPFSGHRSRFALSDDDATTVDLTTTTNSSTCTVKTRRSIPAASNVAAPPRRSSSDPPLPLPVQQGPPTVPYHSSSSNSAASTASGEGEGSPPSSALSSPVSRGNICVSLDEEGDHGGVTERSPSLRPTGGSGGYAPLVPNDSVASTVAAQVRSASTIETERHPQQQQPYLSSSKRNLQSTRGGGGGGGSAVEDDEERSLLRETDEDDGREDAADGSRTQRHHHHKGLGSFASAAGTASSSSVPSSLKQSVQRALTGIIPLPSTQTLSSPVSTAQYEQI